MDNTQTLKKTALNGTLKKLGGKMVDFFGWELPIQFEGIIKEHTAVRNSAGIFDVSHMGQIFIRGANAFKLLQKTNSNDLKKAIIGKGVYSHLLNEKAGVVDDVIAMNLDVQNKSPEYSMLALQGPKAPDMMKVFAPEAEKLPRFGIIEKKLFNADSFINRTGYTGEDGFEITAPHGAINAIWENLMEIAKDIPLTPCGLGARDTLRLEAGYLLYGQDIDDNHTTLEANYGWAVCFDKGEFIGRNALLKQKQNGIERRLTGIALAGPGVPRRGCKVFKDGRQIGELASATYSPTLKRGIGTGYLSEPKLKPGEELEVEIHSKMLKAAVHQVPFYKGTAFK
ncbi:MAG: glycine cleavage system protein T [Elusimicrobia bacterium]|nr:glycine cleavage system protein T [Elusimicrobiota bacterium]